MKMKQMNKMTWILTGLFASLALFVTSPVLADSSHKPYIEVVGQSELEVNPDVVDLRFTLSSEKKSPKLAVQALVAKEKVLLDTLKKAGMAAKDVQISYVSLYPRFTYEKTSSFGRRQRVLKGYQASKTYVACVKDVNKMTHYVSALASANVTSFSTSYRSTKIPTHKQKLLKMAVVAARAKAAILAKNAGVALGGVKLLKELSGGASVRFSNSFGYRARSSSQGARPGAIKMRLTVRMAFYIK